VIVPQAAAADVSLEQMIANAKTRADHEAIARQYEDAAKSHQAKAEEHKKMEAAYRIMSQDKSKLAGFMAHCKKLVTQYGELAKEDLKLAKLHHQFAEQLAE
jgi:hypothetical protein